MFAIILLIAFLFCFVLGRYLYIQVIWGNELRARAVDQWTRELPIIAERGTIKDRNGVTIVSNKTAYSVYVRPRLVDNPERVAEVMSDVFGYDRTKLYNKLKQKSVSEITIAKQISHEKIIELNGYSLKGVYYSKDSIRYYPYGDFLTQVLGIVSSDGRGQNGIEEFYNKYLAGENGEILYETDLLGIPLNGTAASYIPAVKGLDISLTIDVEIQQSAEQAMQIAYAVHMPKSAQCIVMDPSNGEILAMCIKPSYDLNSPPRDDIKRLNSLSRNLLVSDCYEPGSTFKILTASANIEEHYKGNERALSTEYVFNSSRTRTVGGRTIKCWRSHADGKHSNQHICEALSNSCNPCFVDMALALGKSKMYDYIEAFNYGKVTGVDYGGEAQGMVVPLSAVTEGDIARIGFGQTIAVTAIQLASATCAAINGGEYYTPHLLKAVYSEGRQIENIQPIMTNKTVSERTSKIMCEYLERVVSSGSGNQAYIEGYGVGGKTGTAQKYENGIIANGKYVSSFVGFFPSSDPKYLALIVIDEPTGQHYGSTVAAPYAKMIFEGIIKAKDVKPYS